MPFQVTIEKDEDIKALDLTQVSKAIDERADMLRQIQQQAGPTYDASKVTVINVKDGAEFAQQWQERNAELNKLVDRREVLAQFEDDARKAEAARKAANSHPIDPRAFAPGDSRGPRAPMKNLGQMVTQAEATKDQESYKDWAARGAPAGTGLDFQFDVLPSNFLAQAHTPRTIQNTLFETGAGWAPESIRLPGFVDAVTRPVQLLDIIPLGQTNSEKIVYMEETTRTHAAAEKAEGVAFAESTFALTERESSVRKITDSVPVTDEQLEDVAQAESYLNGRLIFGLRQRLDTQSLIGNGTPPNLRGIKNTSGIQTHPKAADEIEAAFFKAMTLVRVTGRAIPTHHLMHPTDWQTVRLRTTADGIYLWGPPSEAGPERMWGLPVVQEDIDSAGTGYVGSFQPAWISLFEKRGVDIQVGYVGDQFKEGKRTIRGDMRFALVVFRPAAFCQVTGL